MMLDEYTILISFKSTFFTDIQETTTGDKDPAFLQVGTWVYPLVKGKSPVLKSKEGAYMFPDLDESLVGKFLQKKYLLQNTYHIGKV